MRYSENSQAECLYFAFQEIQFIVGAFAEDETMARSAAPQRVGANGDYKRSLLITETYDPAVVESGFHFRLSGNHGRTEIVNWTNREDNTMISPSLR